MMKRKLLLAALAVSSIGIIPVLPATRQLVQLAFRPIHRAKRPSPRRQTDSIQGRWKAAPTNE